MKGCISDDLDAPSSVLSSAKSNDCVLGRFRMCGGAGLTHNDGHFVVEFLVVVVAVVVLMVMAVVVLVDEL